MKPNIWRLERALTLPPVSTLSSSYRAGSWQCCRGWRVDLANIFPNIHHATDTADRGDQQCNALWYLDNEHLIFCKADKIAKSLNLNIIYLNLLYTAFYIDIIYHITYIEESRRRFTKWKCSHQNEILAFIWKDLQHIPFTQHSTLIPSAMAPYPSHPLDLTVTRRGGSWPDQTKRCLQLHHQQETQWMPSTHPQQYLV